MKGRPLRGAVIALVLSGAWSQESALFRDFPSSEELAREMAPFAEGMGRTEEDAVRFLRLASRHLEKVYEEKKSLFAQLSALRRFQTSSERLVVEHPKCAAVQALRGQFFQYAPSFAGGDRKKAAACFARALDLDGDDPQVLHCALLFHLNAEGDSADPVERERGLSKADSILTRLEARSGNAVGTEGGRMVARWVPYQRGIWLYRKGRLEEARAKWREHLQVSPQSPWALYFLWSTGPTADRKGSAGTVTAAARSKGNLVLADRVEKESRSP